MQHHTIDHTLTFVHWLLIHLVTYTYNYDSPELLKILQISQENTCVGVCVGVTCVGVTCFCKVASFQTCNVIKKETPAQVFSCEIWEILTNTYLEEQLNDCSCVLITSSYIDFYNSLQCTFFIFTNNFFIAQLEQ